MTFHSNKSIQKKEEETSLHIVSAFDLQFRRFKRKNPDNQSEDLIALHYYYKGKTFIREGYWNQYISNYFISKKFHK